MFEYLQHLFDKVQWQPGLTDTLYLVLLVGWFAWIWPKRDWQQLLADKSLQWRALLSTLAINGLWLLNASVTEGIHAHFLALVTLMLMFGWRLASVLMLLPVSFFCLFVYHQPWMLGPMMLFAVCLPLLLALTVHSLSYHKLPKHLFVFIFVAGFLNAGLSVVSHILAWSTYLWVSTDYSVAYLVDNYLLLIPLLGFPEALLNGMAVTLLVVYRPEWLYDYSDRVYLWRH
ncbi:energy-coupling factor ABC transporter permease [Shewanella algae]|uniref:energy-coupling factor ABC transporter permease n=1 Tax=Shewanella algae TaxID=38313 RepID=UPI001F16B497|nr:energy-coupling factor ABC transporter permease [Shewanella algae]MCE9776636.1 energy-coupling factor ABC transporter permease [Shewanella algae]